MSTVSNAACVVITAALLWAGTALGEEAPQETSPKTVDELLSVSREDKLARCRSVNELGRKRLTARELLKVDSPAVDQLTDNPAAWFAFIVDSGTPFLDRQVAAVRAELPVTPWIERTLSALRQLEDEEEIHHWGLRKINCTNAYLRRLAERKRRVAETVLIMAPQDRVRQVLDEEWVLENELSRFWPVTQEEFAEAPWPLQVKNALTMLLHSSSPEAGAGSSSESRAEADRWFRAWLNLPMQTDRQAKEFVRWTLNERYKNASVMARYHEILREPEFEDAALQIAMGLGRQVLEFWNHPHRQHVGQVLIIDTLRSEQAPRVKAYVAAAVDALREWPSYPGEDTRPLPEPRSSIFEISRQALREENGKAWDRLYLYLMQGALKAMDDPPFQWDSSDVEPEDAPEFLRRYRQWSETDGQVLESLSEAETPDLDEARRWLDDNRVPMWSAE